MNLSKFLMSRFQCALWLTVGGALLLPSCAAVERRPSGVANSKAGSRQREVPGRNPEIRRSRRLTVPTAKSASHRSGDPVIVLTGGQTGDEKDDDAKDGKHDVRTPVSLAPPVSVDDHPGDVPTRLPLTDSTSKTRLTLETLEQWAYENNPTLQQAISVLNNDRKSSRSPIC